MSPDWIKSINHGLFQASMWRRYAFILEYGTEWNKRYHLETLRVGSKAECIRRAREALRQVKLLREKHGKA